MAAPRTPEVRRAEAEHRLIAAAADLVGELGPSNVTLANVGERAGYSRGLATHHFGSKGALMQRLVEAVTQQFRDAMFDLDGAEDLITELRTFVGVYFGVITDLQPVNRARLMLWANAVAHPDNDTRALMTAADREFRGEIEKRIRVAVAAGQAPRTVDPHGLATVVLAMLRGVALQSLIDDHVDLEAARTEIEQLLSTRLQEEER
ncbi:TetR family transcriptional regulator [Mycolicibacterium sp. P9-64]|uniref:TetR/AcrR family transcriptional regulator n=1 Tax=Mycolicibacterium sp. P9-64 TaxID=2024612 RepID=UPI0011EFED94|nr:TetR/AcrR family transcriptional regulator [Mycolicibacterium sp. P9-64]KAA0077204.1 TetR family transcriptional regulator [Mycolicibacterium sp. P9-64]